jgi:hypothetical protein
MAYFAKIDDNNVVTTVVAVHNNVLINQNGIEQEELGIQFLKNLYNEPNAKWVQTSYNTTLGVHRNGGIPLRMNYAQIGGIYDEERDMFIGRKPGTNYVIDYSNGLWKPSIDLPTETTYVENGENKTWLIYFDDENIRFLGSKLYTGDGTHTHIWNSTTSSWDLLTS